MLVDNVTKTPPELSMNKALRSETESDYGILDTYIEALRLELLVLNANNLQDCIMDVICTLVPLTNENDLFSILVLTLR